MTKLNPETQVNLTKQLLSKILSNYNLKALSFTIAKSGIENTTALITTAENKYALRIYRQNKKKETHIQQEVDFMTLLRKNRLPVPEVFLNDKGSFITNFEARGSTWNCILMELMPGKNPKVYSRKMITSMAQTQAIMHKLGMRFAKTQPESKSLTILKEGYFIKNINRAKLKNKNIIAFINRADKFVVRLDPKLPHGFNHLDFDAYGNVLINNDKVSAILDFDDLMLSPIIVCLGYSLWGTLCATNKMSNISLYIQEYEKIRKLSGLEKSYLQNILVFRNYVIGSLLVMFSGEKKIKDLNKIIKLEALILKYTLV